MVKNVIICKAFADLFKHCSYFINDFSFNRKKYIKIYCNSFNIKAINANCSMCKDMKDLPELSLSFFIALSQKTIDVYFLHITHILGENLS